jgi:pumilio RNA-binding family
MEEFRNKKAQRWELQDLVGHMVEFSRDQEGSRLIQRKLEGLQCTDNEKDMVFSEVFKEALGLMTDVFGNYVIQKLFEHGLPNHRKLLATVVKGNVLALTLQTYGCRVIQKALEVIDEEDQTMVASELDGHVLRCVLDQNGNHVIQKCIERIPPQNVTFIVQSFIGNVQNLAVHAYGCRVIQRILEYCEDHYEVISPILDEILDNVHILARDQYGNYVVQHVLINGKELYQCAIIERLRNDSLELAQHKFASNVVEKMFHYGSHEDKTIILADLLRINADGTSALHVMMKDQYANYVVQKIIDLADDAQRRQIIDHIKPHIATLRRYTYGKHIIARIEKLHTMNKAAPNQ